MYVYIIYIYIFIFPSHKCYISYEKMKQRRSFFFFLQNAKFYRIRVDSFIRTVYVSDTIPSIEIFYRNVDFRCILFENTARQKVLRFVYSFLRPLFLIMAMYCSMIELRSKSQSSKYSSMHRCKLYYPANITTFHFAHTHTHTRTLIRACE